MRKGPVGDLKEVQAPTRYRTAPRGELESLAHATVPEVGVYNYPTH